MYYNNFNVQTKQHYYSMPHTDASATGEGRQRVQNTLRQLHLPLYTQGDSSLYMVIVFTCVLVYSDEIFCHYTIRG